MKGMHSSKDGLTWHGVIPEDELWLKLGGDKGHGSFKFNMQLCNVLHPNSQTNLHIGLDMYREAIKRLQGMPLGLVINYLVNCLMIA